MRAIRNFLTVVVFFYCIFLISPDWVKGTQFFVWLQVVSAIGYMIFHGFKIAGLLGRQLDVRLFVLHITLLAALVIVASASVYLSYGFDDAKSGTPYGAALYFSAVTFSTLGFGDITPAIGPSRAIASLQAIAGNLHLALFAGAIFYVLVRAAEIAASAENQDK